MIHFENLILRHILKLNRTREQCLLLDDEVFLSS